MENKMTDLTKITTPFGLLDDETQSALKAHKGPIEVLQVRYVGQELYWYEDVIYRAKPAPHTHITDPWDHIAEWVQWIARDENGEIWGYDYVPEIEGLKWFNSGYCSIDLTALKLDAGTCDWRDSLQQRPSKGETK